MQRLYPPIKPFATSRVAVDAIHTLYIEESGSAHGLPVLFLHGGPGAGCEPYHRRFFDPQRYRIILFDQRGCGRSTPHAELVGNNTQGLLADIEVIRQHLGVDRWLVFGGSWGSTLALRYAQTYPMQVLGLVLRGIFLCRPSDIQWFYQSGASRVFPDYWEDYLRPIPADERGDLVSAYYRRLTGSDEVARLAAAKAWSLWEGRTATLRPAPSVVEHFGAAHTALSLARIECHYFMHDSFLQSDQILRDAHRLATIPGIIIHGRYDMVCPIDQAFALHQAWPQAELQVIGDAGHSATEPGITAALVKATDDFAARLT